MVWHTRFVCALEKSAAHMAHFNQLINIHRAFRDRERMNETEKNAQSWFLCTQKTFNCDN